MVGAGPVLFCLQVSRVLAQALGVVGGRAHVTADQLTAVPAHLRQQCENDSSAGTRGKGGVIV